MSIKVIGLNNLQTNLGKLPKNLQKYSKEIADATAKEIQRRARTRIALSNDWSHALKDNIEVVSLFNSPNRYELVCGAFMSYAYYQEYGFRKHLVKPGWETGAGMTFGDWQISKGITPRPMYVEKARNPEGYYFGPSVRSTVRDLPKISEKAVNKAIKESGFKGSA